MHGRCGALPGCERGAIPSLPLADSRALMGSAPGEPWNYRRAGLCQSPPCSLWECFAMTLVSPSLWPDSLFLSPMALGAHLRHQMARGVICRGPTRLGRPPSHTY